MHEHHHHYVTKDLTSANQTFADLLLIAPVKGGDVDGFDILPR